MEYSIKKQEPPKSRLEDSKAEWVEKTVVWEVETRSVDLTPSDIEALRKQHKTKDVNLKRAGMVKKMMLEGLPQARIIKALRSHGHGFGERMIKHDSAALSRVAKKTRKKVQ